MKEGKSTKKIRNNEYMTGLTPGQNKKKQKNEEMIDT